MPLLLQLDVLGCSVSHCGLLAKLFEKRWIETLREMPPQRRQSDIAGAG